MTSSTSNQGGGPSSCSLDTPARIACADSRLIISDNQNHRVLIYNSIPVVDNENADEVIGQPNFTSDMPYNGGVKANTLCNPDGLFCDDKCLVIVENQRRCLIHYPFPKIYAIEPQYSISGEQITLDIIGTNFTDVVINQGMSIKLKRNSTEIMASNLNNVNKQLLSCVFDISGLSAGAYDIQLEVYGRITRLLKNFFMLNQVVKPAEWEINDMGVLDAPALSGNFYGIDVGDADNDGFQEALAANRQTRMYVFNKLASSWLRSELPNGSATEYYSGVVIFDGDRDEEMETYGSSLDNNIYQYTGPAWDKTTIGANENMIYDLTYGDGNNDGRLEIYTACANGHVYQFDKDVDWNRTDLGAVSAQVYSIVVGDGNSDGEFEVYTACSDNKIYQYKYNGASWDITVVGSGSAEMYDVAVGDGNLDSQMEVYGANQDGKVYQFKWQISSWVSSVVGFGADEMHGIALSDGDNDGTNELYAVSLDGHIYQFSFMGAQWNTNDLGSAGTPLYALAVGDGDNDNQFEVYTVSGSNHLYQFKIHSVVPTMTSTPTATVTSTLTVIPTLTVTPTPFVDFRGSVISKNYIYAAPNPVRGHIANIFIFTNQPAEVSGKLFTTSNQEVLSFRRYYGQGKNTERINVSNLANGVYLLLIKAKGSDGTEERVIKKIAIVK